jgi:hypothetical protein
MLKHIGRHGDRKIVVIYNMVPGEDHMCLVTYSDSLPSLMHDEVMRVVESAGGQGSKDLADALHRHIMADGNNALVSIHKGGFMKKVQTKQVILTPNAKTSVRLDELNKILGEMAKGQDAVKRLAEIDNNAGYRDPEKNRKTRDIGEPANIPQQSVNTSGVLSDADLAQINLDQAAAMKAQAKTLLAEAKRLEEEANQFAPKKKANVRKPTTKKATA